MKNSNAMIGAAMGDIAGSRFEWFNIKSKDFELITNRCRVTDDTVMTLAVGKALVDHQDDNDFEACVKYRLRMFGEMYPYAGYGGMFRAWLSDYEMGPYNSFGNGSAMRVSACGMVRDTLEETLELAKVSASVTHNHPDGIMGAQCIAAAIFMARNGASKEEIKKYSEENFYDLNFSLDEIREEYEFDVSCMGSVPPAMAAFLESESFEDAIRNAISIGGDSDTIAAMAGSVAYVYYDVDRIEEAKKYREIVFDHMDDYMKRVIEEFEDVFLKKQLKFTDFYDAFHFLLRHEHFEDKFLSCLDIMAVKVCPETGCVENDREKNTVTEVWLETGKPGYHDPELDCGGSTFEEAIVKLANRVYYTYGQ